MNEEYEVDIVTLIDDDGVEHEFELVGELDTDEGHFLALEPTHPESSDLTEASTYYIFESVYAADGEEELVEVYDEELIDKLAPIFESQFEEKFYDEEDED